MKIPICSLVSNDERYARPVKFKYKGELIREAPVGIGTSTKNLTFEFFSDQSYSIGQQIDVVQMSEGTIEENVKILEKHELYWDVDLTDEIDYDRLERSLNGMVLTADTFANLIVAIGNLYKNRKAKYEWKDLPAAEFQGRAVADKVVQDWLTKYLEEMQQRGYEAVMIIPEAMRVLFRRYVVEQPSKEYDKFQAINGELS